MKSRLTSLWTEHIKYLDIVLSRRNRCVGGLLGSTKSGFNETMAVDEGLMNGSVFIIYVGWHLKNYIPTNGIPASA